MTPAPSRPCGFSHASVAMLCSTGPCFACCVPSSDLNVDVQVRLSWTTVVLAGRVGSVQGAVDCVVVY